MNSLNLTDINFDNVEEKIKKLEFGYNEWNIFSWNSNLSLSLLLGVCALVFYFLKQIKDKPNKNVKMDGPPHLPIIGALHHLVGPGKDPLKEITGWYRKYGKSGIFQSRIFFQDFCFLSNPTYLQKALESVEPGHLNKPRRMYDALAADTVTNGIVFADYPVWSHNRKVIVKGFNYRGIQSQMANTNLHIRRLISRLIHIADTTKDFADGRFCKLLDHTSLDIILHSIMDFELTTAKERAAFHEELLITKYCVSQRIKKPWLLFDPFFWFHPLRSEMNRSNAEIIKFVDTLILRYKEMQSKRRDDAFKKRTDEIGVKPLKSIVEEMIDAGFSDNQIFQETVMLIYAGHDTTGLSIVFLLLRLALNPEIQERCRQEVDKLYESKEAKQSLDVDLTIADLKTLEYLDMCMKESLRITPPIPAFVRRLDTPLKLDDGLVLPPGKNVLFSPWAIHRNPEIYPDPEKFDPDRFLPEEVKERHPYNFITFAGGMRNCVGYKMAPLAVKLGTARILRHFVVESKDKWEDLEFIYEITVALKRYPNLIFKRRPEIH